MSSWIENLSPDFAATARRFPVSVAFLAAAALVLVLSNNDVLSLTSGREQSICLGLLAGAAFALGGTLFRESRPQQRASGLVLAYLVPPLAFLIYAIDLARVVVAWPWLAIALLWCSVAGFTVWGSGPDRAEQQTRFWWLNYHAAATAAIGIVGAGVVSLGLFAIERALDTLFDLDIYWVFSDWVMPVVWLFLAPAYWLSTLPRLSDFSIEAVERPDLLGRALTIFAQFVLAPLLFVYGAILLAYTAQIVVTQHLPQGTIAWMVTGFVITGAATWLILYAPFVANRTVVRWFQRTWFWLTLLPLALLAVAVFVRINAYGLTAERIELIVGFAWAAGIAALFLGRRGDIRAIPALAAVLIGLATVGPWSIENAPLLDQAGRLDAALSNAGAGATSALPVKWDPDSAETVRGAARYLDANRGGDLLREVLARHGVTVADEGSVDLLALFGRLHLDDDPSQTTYESLSRDLKASIDLSSTPVLLSDVDVWDNQDGAAAGLHLRIEAGSLSVWRSGPDKISVPLSSWAGSERAGNFLQPGIGFDFDGVRYRLLADSGTIENQPDHPELGRHFTYLHGWLYASALPPKPTP